MSSDRSENSARKKPKKPTQPFGSIAFSPTGKMRKHVIVLSSDKAKQEQQVMEAFARLLKRSYHVPRIESWQSLDGRDHDSSASTDDGEVEIQIAELVDRSYCFPISREEYGLDGPWDEFVVKKSGVLPWGVDRIKKTAALLDLVIEKMRKNYAKPDDKALWLIVFTTGIHYNMENVEEGKHRQSDGLRLVQWYLREYGSGAFEEIWFTDLETRPVLSWPEDRKVDPAEQEPDGGGE